jgi:inward rectifier potassium channel
MSETPQKPPPLSAIAHARPGARVAIIKGQDGSRFTDFYHGLLIATWPSFFLQTAAIFLGVNLIFALLYLVDPGGIAHARPGSFADAFFFSVQTIGTLGYGVMAPRSLWANLLVTGESFLGVFNIALAAGLVFARFSRPSARILFSNIAVITPFDGVPTLMFRAANQRGNSIVDAAITVSLAHQHVTREGISMRRFQELKMVREKTSLFALSWTVMHHIDETSPLHRLTQADWDLRNLELIAMLSGVDETIADRIYARHAYGPEDIVWDRRFVDVLSVTPQGKRMVDLTRFHDTA